MTQRDCPQAQREDPLRAASQPATLQSTDEPARHPGQILIDDFLEPLGISGRGLAATLQVSASCISNLTGGGRRMTGDLALRLGCYFGTSAWYWMNLQARFELERARRTLPEATAGIVPFHQPPTGCDQPGAIDRV